MPEMLPAADFKHLQAVWRSAGVEAWALRDLIPLQHAGGMVGDWPFKYGMQDETALATVPQVTVASPTAIIIITTPTIIKTFMFLSISIFLISASASASFPFASLTLYLSLSSKTDRKSVV